MSKQTAVDWLFDHLVPHLDWSKVEDRELFRKLKEEAVAMEKEQIVDAWSEGKKNPFIVQHSECCENNGKQYYNETYGSNKG